MKMIELLIVAGLTFISGLSVGRLVEKDRDSAEEMMYQYEDHIFHVQHDRGRGTGFIVQTKSGKTAVMTNAHVCGGRTTFSVTDARGKVYGSQLIAVYPLHDLCLLTAPKGYEPVILADRIVYDERVYSAGYPLLPRMSSTKGYYRNPGWDQDRLEIPLEKCVGPGMSIRNVEEEMEEGPDKGKKVKHDICIRTRPIIQTTMPVSYGASGSPIFNAQGELVGVVMALYGTLSWCMGVPLEHVKAFLDMH